MYCFAGQMLTCFLLHIWHKWLVLWPHSKKVLDSNPGPFVYNIKRVLGSIPAWGRSFCVEFACSPRVCVGFLHTFRFPPTIKNTHVRHMRLGWLNAAVRSVSSFATQTPGKSWLIPHIQATFSSNHGPLRGVREWEPKRTLTFWTASFLKQ